MVYVFVNTNMNCDILERGLRTLRRAKIAFPVTEVQERKDL